MGANRARSELSCRLCETSPCRHQWCERCSNWALASPLHHMTLSLGSNQAFVACKRPCRVVAALLVRDSSASLAWTELELSSQAATASPHHYIACTRPHRIGLTSPMWDLTALSPHHLRETEIHNPSKFGNLPIFPIYSSVNLVNYRLVILLFGTVM